LFEVILSEKPDKTLIGGNLLPDGLGMIEDIDKFITNYLLKKYQKKTTKIALIISLLTRAYKTHFIFNHICVISSK